MLYQQTVTYSWLTTSSIIYQSVFAVTCQMPIFTLLLALFLVSSNSWGKYAHLLVTNYVCCLVLSILSIFQLRDVHLQSSVLNTSGGFIPWPKSAEYLLPYHLASRALSLNTAVIPAVAVWFISQDWQCDTLDIMLNLKWKETTSPPASISELYNCCRHGYCKQPDCCPEQKQL